MVIFGSPLGMRGMGEPPRVVSGWIIWNFSDFAGANVAVLTMLASSRCFGVASQIWANISIINLFWANYGIGANGRPREL